MTYHLRAESLSEKEMTMLSLVKEQRMAGTFSPSGVCVCVSDGYQEGSSSLQVFTWCPLPRSPAQSIIYPHIPVNV